VKHYWDAGSVYAAYLHKPAGGSLIVFIHCKVKHLQDVGSHHATILQGSLGVSFMVHFIKQASEKDLFIIDVNIRVSFQTNMKGY
jgi:hypothetical protein